MSQSQHDPFSLFGDGQSTVIRPRPGGRGPTAAAEPARGGETPASPVGAMPDLPFAAEANPLIRAAGPLLALAPRLAQGGGPGSIEDLRRRVVEALNRFERDAAAAGVEPQTLRAAHYALCALIDDLVLNTPWGGHGGWARRPLSGEFHNDNTGGDRFFALVERMEREPARYLDILELMYVCLALGFQGRFRGGRREATSLADIRDGLYRVIRSQRPPVERELSPSWRGVAAAHRPVSEAVPNWVVGVAAAALLVLVYAGFHFKLGGYADQINVALGSLPPRGEVTLARAGGVQPAPLPPLPASSQVVGRILPEIEAVLPQEIRAGLIGATEDPQTVMVRLRNQGLFPSGDANVDGRYRSILERLAEVLERHPGRLLVVGHSDNVPIRNSTRFASNWELSRARARAVADVLVNRLSDPGRVHVEGRADTQPLASNATPEGRAQNRRVEVTLIKG